MTEFIAPMDGAVIPGGCDDCDAYQEVYAHYHGRNIHAIFVRHDDDCPTLAQMEGNAS